jgi:D-3-phosphoglycerate dehydrogenase
VQIFRDRGIDVTFDPSIGKDKDKLLEVIGEYDGLAIRSATKVTEKVIAAATNLKVIGRAGIGVDNVDIPAASKKGIIVMNTPFGNSITTAEHAIAMMFAVARQIPEAKRLHPCRQVGEVPLHGRRTDRQDAGRDRRGQYRLHRHRPRALGLDEGARLRPVPERGARAEIGARRSSSTSFWRRPISSRCTCPFTEKTANILSAENLAKTKKGVRIVNCARGGLVDEAALAELLKSGHVAGAAFDVFKPRNRRRRTRCSTCPTSSCTPHLGASTTEAQENVALQVAEQMSDYLLTGAVSNALNMPSVTAEEAGSWALAEAGRASGRLRRATDRRRRSRRSTWSITAWSRG